jgi:CDP-4-dehydro-6-deoxyglucose reductase, E1
MISKKLSSVISEYYKKQYPIKKFIRGKTIIPVSGKVFDDNEFVYAIDAILDGWWTEGRYAKQFEQQFSKYLGIRYTSLVNSGSSANLIAFSSLTSLSLGTHALKPGDEIITVAAGFPTTVNPIIQNRCIPVFVDIDLVTKNATAKHVLQAISKKTKAIIMAHTLGNILPLDDIKKITKKYSLWFIEDCCDALGGEFDGKKVGSFGDIATFSFYPAHQITMGEGGALVTNNSLLHRSIRQFRDWGRDCWCDTGKDNTCGKRFTWKMGNLPYGYDHKYIYSQIGYNLKLTDMQAALGVAQLLKLQKFISIRRDNYQFLRKNLEKYNSYLSFTDPLPKSDPSWFGFMIVIHPDAPFERLDLVNFLESKKIQTRSLFAGNLIHHPAYQKRSDIRISEILSISDLIMERGFWIGVYPGITHEMRTYVVEMFDEFFVKIKDRT